MKTFAGYYTEFKLSKDFELPNNLLSKIREVWDRKYRDLYENGGKCNVEEAFEEVLQTFGMPINTIGHQRYVYMAIEEIIDILYDAITGDAISPFATAKRDLFNWWIIDVVPSAYYLKLPCSSS